MMDRITGWQRRALACFGTATLMEELLLRRLSELPPSKVEPEHEVVVQVLAQGDLHDVLLHLETRSEIAVADALQAILPIAVDAWRGSVRPVIPEYAHIKVLLTERDHVLAALRGEAPRGRVIWGTPSWIGVDLPAMLMRQVEADLTLIATLTDWVATPVSSSHLLWQQLSNRKQDPQPMARYLAHVLSVPCEPWSAESVDYS